MTELKLLPPATKPVSSVARVADDWYVVATSEQLRNKPLATEFLGAPVVAFRTEAGTPGVLLDRCPHRNVPLSMGRVDGDALQCGYHGWRFAPDGACLGIPGLCGDDDLGKRGAMAYATREQDGLVWAWGEPGVEPTREPFRFPYTDRPGYATAIDVVEAEGTLHATAENALDVPHTAYLHKGLFRGVSEPNEIEVVVKRWGDRVEAEYIGEPAPTGLVGRLLAPGGGTVTHFDRFILPCVAQVEYKLSERAHVCVSSALTPLSDFRTRLFAVVTFKLPFPNWLVKLVLRPVGRRIFSQDAKVLKLQTETVRRFGGEQFMSTELDVLGQGIRKLLRDAERGQRPELEEPVERRLTMRV